MAKQINTTLTALFCERTKAPGKYAAGDGLYFLVDKTGAKRWIQRININGKRTEMGLGGYPAVSLKDARADAHIYSAIAHAGGNPIDYRRQKQLEENLEVGGPLFCEIAKQVYDGRKHSFTNEKFCIQWWTQLETYVPKAIWNKPIDQVTSGDMLMTFMPIWLAKEETARRVSQRVRAIFDYAKAANLYSGENPMVAAKLGLPKQKRRVKHHEALPHGKTPAFIQQLRKEGGKETATLAFEFLIATVTRTNETLKAEWPEIDFDHKIWTIPGERMKMKLEHRVPLSTRAIEILDRMCARKIDSKYIFPSAKPTKPLSQMVFLECLRRMEVPVTAHGFRSTFRDWAGEETNFAHEVCERTLAHSPPDKTQAAYARSDLLEKRRPLMEAWASFITKPRQANVIPITRKKA